MTVGPGQIEASGFNGPGNGSRGAILGGVGAEVDQLFNLGGVGEATGEGGQNAYDVFGCFETVGLSGD